MDNSLMIGIAESVNGNIMQDIITAQLFARKLFQSEYRVRKAVQLQMPLCVTGFDVIKYKLKY